MPSIKEAPPRLHLAQWKRPKSGTAAVSTTVAVQAVHSVPEPISAGSEGTSEGCTDKHGILNTVDKGQQGRLRPSHHLRRVACRIDCCLPPRGTQVHMTFLCTEDSMASMTDQGALVAFSQWLRTCGAPVCYASTAAGDQLLSSDAVPLQ